MPNPMQPRTRRRHPANPADLSDADLASYLRREATLLAEQKQTAIARGLREAADRLYTPGPNADDLAAALETAAAQPVEDMEDDRLPALAETCDDLAERLRMRWTDLFPGGR